MAYTIEQVSSLFLQQERLIGELRRLLARFVNAAHISQDERVQEHLRHGVARRVNVLIQCVINIYRIFPPNLERPLSRDSLSDVQINLHAYVINLCGLFDNCAWAFILQSGLVAQFREPKQIGLFKPHIVAHLPKPLREYLQSERIKGWQAKYLTNYRDALAHRIPLYIPPAVWSPAENLRYNTISIEIDKCVAAQQWDRIDALRAEQDRLGTPCFGFLHSFSRNKSPTLVGLHTQVLSDGATIVEFGSLFLQHWREPVASVGQV